jgi:hypothetical protein
MVKAAKTYKRLARSTDIKQPELDFMCAANCRHPIFPYGKLKLNQPFYPTLQRSKVSKKIIGNEDEITVVILETIKKGLFMMRSLIFETEINFLEIKAITTIITTYLPERSRDQKTLKCYKLWNSFSRNLSRSNRRTSLYRLSLAAQEMGNEIPELESHCETLVIKLYRLIKGDTGKIKNGADRNEWEHNLESKPTKYIMVGTKFYQNLKS